MIKILFVCHGNICRSPMAEFIMKELVAEAGCAGDFEIASAATSTEELGNGVYPPVKRLLGARGIDCSAKRARQITKSDYLEYDLLIGMDRANIRNMKNCWGGDPDGKMRMLLSYCGLDREVADPWYTGDFDATLQDVLSGCRRILEECGY
ncbi:MAG: low molecular weight phosphotyrosine protein phosphatase [Lentisphaeria bacterium]|nr:low molecular weight phosphotyrosine protein phosphatase [Lentisphaeria bacterium]